MAQQLDAALESLHTRPRLVLRNFCFAARERKVLTVEARPLRQLASKRSRESDSNCPFCFSAQPCLCHSPTTPGSRVGSLFTTALPDSFQAVILAWISSVNSRPNSIE